jgi:hypothetical protein
VVELPLHVEGAAKTSDADVSGSSREVQFWREVAVSSATVRSLQVITSAGVPVLS